MTETIQLTIDDRAVSAPAGMNLIEAAKLVDIDIPHFCYHPQLCIAGNCRMCLVEVGLPKLGADRQPLLDSGGRPEIVWQAKLTIACNTPVAAGMVVRTRTERVIKARQGVMEFLLINHPLDCPICDQAGECRLQELAVDYGRPASRFVEDKERKPKKTPLGPKIVLDDERCIFCSRCIRFMRDVVGQDCLGFVNRGGKSCLTCYPGRGPDSNYDLNIVDLCPVGALTSTDFRFRQRVWFLKETHSICPHCATGCNIVISSREGVVYRQTPRDNPDVNGCWMCDYGRLNYKFIGSPDRLREPQDRAGAALPWPEAIRRAAEPFARIRGGGPGRVAVLGSARASIEELFLLHRLAVVLETKILDVVPHAGEADRLLLHADRTPNQRGALLTGVAATPPGSRIAEIVQGIRSGAIRALFVLGEDAVAAGIDAETLGRLEWLVAVDILPNATTRAAHLTLPGASFAEKDGAFINVNGRLQRFAAAVPAPGAARPELQTLAELLQALGSEAGSTPADVFGQMARALRPLAGLTWAGIGDRGIALEKP